MSKVKITVDSTNDLPGPAIEKYDIEVVPLGVTLGDKLYKDGVNITQKKLFDYFEKNRRLAKSNAVNAVEYYDCFKKIVDSGREAVHINISSKMSSCYQNAVMAASDFSGVYPFDSLNLSTGSGLLALEAAQMSDEGASAAQIVGRLEALRPKVRASFVIESLDYLRCGGRCSALSAFGANALKLKPLIFVENGAMSVGKKYRGPLAKCLEDYAGDILSRLDVIDKKRVFVTHTCGKSGIAEKIADKLKNLGVFHEVLVSEAGCTVSSHCGPGTLGILYFEK